MRRPSKEVLEDQSKSQKILNQTLKISLKHSSQNIYGGLADHIYEWKKLISDKVILQMVLGENIEFKNNVPSF